MTITNGNDDRTPNTTATTLATRLTTLRTENNLTHRQAAERTLTLSPRRIRHIETGRGKAPTLTEVITLADAYRVPILTLMPWAPAPQPA